MPEYRVYTIGSDGHFFNVAPLECADDAEAIERAEQLLDGHDIELWQRDRQIARIDHKRKMQF
jgi:hypothetical protein